MMKGRINRACACRFLQRAHTPAAFTQPARLIPDLLAEDVRSTDSTDPTVFVVEHDSDMRQVIASLLNAARYETRCFDSGCGFLARHDPAIPGCILLEWDMPDLSGFDVQSRLAAAGSDCPIIVLSSPDRVADSVFALRAGAINFLVKPVDQQDLLAAVEEAIYVDREQRRLTSLKQSVEEHVARLTPREREVLAHVVAGRMNKQIAGDLGIVVKTIKVHRARAIRKMGVRSLAQLIRLVVESGVELKAPAPRRCERAACGAEAAASPRQRGKARTLHEVADRAADTRTDISTAVCGRK
jgi:FixJ family two-component response regulator